MVALVALVGENVAVAPTGKPVAEKLTGLAKPATGVMLMTSLVEAPAVRLRFVDAGVILKVSPAVMTSVTLVVVVVPPEVPVIVSG